MAPPPKRPNNCIEVCRGTIFEKRKSQTIPIDSKRKRIGNSKNWVSIPQENGLSGDTIIPIGGRNAIERKDDHRDSEGPLLMGREVDSNRKIVELERCPERVISSRRRLL